MQTDKFIDEFNMPPAGGGLGGTGIGAPGQQQQLQGVMRSPLVNFLISTRSAMWLWYFFRVILSIFEVK